MTLRLFGNLLVVTMVALLAYYFYLAYSIHSGDVEANRAMLVLLTVFAFFFVVPGTAVSLLFAIHSLAGHRRDARAFLSAFVYALAALASLSVVVLALRASWPFDTWPALSPPTTPQPMSPENLNFAIKGDVALDQRSGLTWARCSVGQTWRPDGHCFGKVRALNWEEAQQQAQGAWRLPTYDELRTLIDEPQPRYMAVTFLIDTETFPDMDQATSSYWTSTGSETANSLGPVTMIVSFDGRFATRGGPSTRDANWAVRLVRNEK